MRNLAKLPILAAPVAMPPMPVQEPSGPGDNGRAERQEPMFTVRVPLLTGLINRGTARWMWLMRQPLRAVSFLSVVLSPRVTEAELAERNRLCDTCPRLLVELDVRGVRARRFCSSCRCPKWFLAELGRKNRWQGHECPAKRHPPAGRERRIEALREAAIERFRKTGGNDG